MFLLQDLKMEYLGDCDVATVLHMVIPKQFLVSSEATDAKTHNIDETKPKPPPLENFLSFLHYSEFSFFWMSWNKDGMHNNSYIEALKT